VERKYLSLSIDVDTINYDWQGFIEI